MWKSCARCGKIHDSKYPCKNPRRYYPHTKEKELRSRYAWTEKSLEIREKAMFLCEVCRDQDNRFTYNDLEVHHINSIKAAPEQLLDNFNLVCLCVPHHKEADAGKISKEYLRSLAYKRENKLSEE